MKPYAVFDFDGTCITGDASEVVLEYACAKGLLTRAEVDTVYETEKSNYRAAAILCSELIEPLSREFIAEALSASTLTVRPEILTLTRELSDCEIWVISASSEKVVEVALIHFSLPFRCIGLTLGTAPYPIDEGKVECIKAYIHKTERPVFAVGDTIHDFPMLEYATGCYLML